MGNVMSPRVVLGADLIEGVPPLPADVADIPVWSQRTECTIGSKQSWEYRHSDHDRCLVLQHVASIGTGKALYVAWVPSGSRDGANPVFEAIAPLLAATGALIAHWECLNDNGALTPVFDGSPEASTALAHWPETWRERMPEDPLEGPPTGRVILGEVLA